MAPTPLTAEETRQAAAAAKLASTAGAVNEVLERRKEILVQLSVLEGEAFDAKTKTLELETEALTAQAQAKQALEEKVRFTDLLLKKQKELSQAEERGNSTGQIQSAIDNYKRQIKDKQTLIKLANGEVLKNKEP